jgi:hypothetical protein
MKAFDFIRILGSPTDSAIELPRPALAFREEIIAASHLSDESRRLQILFAQICRVLIPALWAMNDDIILLLNLRWL